jgi:hypothetical protein
MVEPTREDLLLADLVQVKQRLLQALAESGHTTEAGALELLALEERLAVLEETNIVAGDRLHQVLRRRDLAQSNLEVVLVVEGVEQVLVEGVDIVKTGKRAEDGRKLLVKRSKDTGSVGMSGMRSDLTKPSGWSSATNS